MWIPVCHIFSILWGISLVSAQDSDTLRFVNILFRHGDRTPIHMIPGDPNNETTWTEGLGQLTQIGVKQEIDLGVYLRSVYDGYISSTYNMNEIYIRSTNIDRALMSGVSVMSGFYPTSEEQKRITGLPQQPVPIHTVPEEIDYIFLTNKYENCIKYQQLFNSTENSTYLREQIKKFQPVVDLIRNATGQEIDWRNASGFSDTLFIENLKNLTWPEWVTQDAYHSLTTELRPTWYWRDWCMMPKYQGGPLLKHMIDDMKLKQQNLMGARNFKMMVYSAHDTNVIGLLCALGTFNNITVPYSACIMLEMHESAESDYFLRVYYRNESSSQNRIQLTIPGCEADCPFEMFLNLTSDAVPGSDEDLCGSRDWLPLNSMLIVVSVTVACGVIMLVMVLIVNACCHRKCKRRPVTRHYGKIRIDSPRTASEEMPMMLSGAGSDLED